MYTHGYIVYLIIKYIAFKVLLFIFVRDSIYV